MFIIIPIDVAANSNIKNISKLVYGYLFGYKQTFQSFPTAKQIADDLKKSIKTISISLLELQDNDLIEITKSGRKNQYQFSQIEYGNKGVNDKAKLKKIKPRMINQEYGNKGVNDKAKNPSKEFRSEMESKGKAVHPDLNEFLEFFEEQKIIGVSTEVINFALSKYGRNGMIEILKLTRPVIGIERWGSLINKYLLAQFNKHP